MNYREYNWLDTKRNIPMYGIQAQIEKDGKWFNTSERGKPLIFESKSERDLKLKELKKYVRK